MTARTALLALAALALTFQAACSSSGLNRSAGGIYAPGQGPGADVDGLVVGHRLMAAGQFELALQAYTRAAGEQGLNVDTLSALGSANLRLGRLGQAERLMRRALEQDAGFAPAWNNLGVILTEQGKTAEAAEVFRRAFATDNGNSDEIRNNLREALARLEDPGYVPMQGNPEFQLVLTDPADFSPPETSPGDIEPL